MHDMFTHHIVDYIHLHNHPHNKLNGKHGLVMRLTKLTKWNVYVLNW